MNFFQKLNKNFDDLETKIYESKFLMGVSVMATITFFWAMSWMLAAIIK